MVVREGLDGCAILPSITTKVVYKSKTYRLSNQNRQIATKQFIRHNQSKQRKLRPTRRSINRFRPISARQQIILTNQRTQAFYINRILFIALRSLQIWNKVSVCPIPKIKKGTIPTHLSQISGNILCDFILCHHRKSAVVAYLGFTLFLTF